MNEDKTSYNKSVQENIKEKEVTDSNQDNEVVSRELKNL